MKLKYQPVASLLVLFTLVANADNVKAPNPVSFPQLQVYSNLSISDWTSACESGNAAYGGCPVNTGSTQMAKIFRLTKSLSYLSYAPVNLSRSGYLAMYGPGGISTGGTRAVVTPVANTANLICGTFSVAGLPIGNTGLLVGVNNAQQTWSAPATLNGPAGAPGNVNWGVASNLLLEPVFVLCLGTTAVPGGPGGTSPPFPPASIGTLTFS